MTTLELPTAKTEPRKGFDGRKLLIYGPYKSGKTTLASGLTDNPLFLATEPGQDALSVYRQPIGSWQDFLNVAASLRDGLDVWPFDLLVIDTVDELARLCAEHVIAGMAKSAGFDGKAFHHASDFEYGKGWDAVSQEFRLKVAKLCNLGFGVVFISHEKESVIKTRTGAEITKVGPDVAQKGMRKWLLGFVDVIAHSAVIDTKDGKEHVLQLQPTETMEAGARVQPGGELPAQVPLTADALRATLEKALA